MKTLLSILLVAVCFTACAKRKATRLNNISVGMNKSDVLDVMGEPETTNANGEKTEMIYRLKDATSGRTPYFVRLENNKVTEYGRLVGYSREDTKPNFGRPLGPKVLINVGGHQPASE